MDVRSPSIVLNYRGRADSLFAAARDLFMLDLDAYGPAIGTIALADALLVACEGSLARSDDHRNAARRLRAWCAANCFSEGGIKHFEWLIEMKGHFSYDDGRVDPRNLEMAKVKMEQFFAWTFSTFPAVAQVRETNDAG